MIRTLLFCLTFATPLAAETLRGPVRVIDADTIDIGAAANIRLVGIDAAEMGQTCRAVSGEGVDCGALATEGAVELFSGRAATCEVEGRDRYDRVLATCRAGGVDIGAELVRTGLARTYRSDTTYAEEEKEAALLSRGLWAYEMDDPSVWRAAMRGQQRTSTSDTAPDGCEIKGNISENGQIYHLPGSRFYANTRIAESKGERWFCSEAEARTAGWRPVR
ncbi:thermonuclease family protein [uncultured Jannaschia sp.]|uniref:thermonuclease family protein n=1 Tax=uncultured Jannaschia sp. TaxID=293347 RepID=UPI0026202D23|nr:thermonuclease family protein [uncultured Jannaschia sp.]